MIGLGKAGLPLAAVMADVGVDVVGIDLSRQRVDDVNGSMNPIPEEPQLAELLKKHGGKGLKASTEYKDAADCTAYIVVVPLFIKDDKTPDFSAIESAFSALSRILKDGDLVVLETTVPPGTTAGLVRKILNKAGKDYFLAHSPERIMTGYSIARYREFPKVVGGVNPESGKKAFELYSRFCMKVSIASDATTAETVKLAEGIYRDVNIAFSNEIFKVCDEIGVDYYEVRQHTKHDYCNLLIPGNVGGHCIPVYPWFLINSFDVPLIRKAREINDGMINYYYEKVKQLAKGGKVLVVGISFREGVKETAYSRSIPFIKLLQANGYDVFVYDPLYMSEEIEHMGFVFKDIREQDKTDVVVVMNDYPAIDFTNKNVIFVRGAHDFNKQSSESR